MICCLSFLSWTMANVHHRPPSEAGQNLGERPSPRNVSLDWLSPNWLLDIASSVIERFQFALMLAGSYPGNSKEGDHFLDGFFLSAALLHQFGIVMFDILIRVARTQGIDNLTYRGGADEMLRRRSRPILKANVGRSKTSRDCLTDPSIPLHFVRLVLEHKF